MTKLAVIDIDGVVANATARFAKAEEAKQAYMSDPNIRMNAALEGKNSATDFYWREAFNPIHVPLDTLIEGADDCIIALTLQCYEVLFLTSRPASMREATFTWLYEQNLIGYDESFRLVMKHSAFQFDKTVKWKVGIVQTLATMLDAKEVLFVSDEQKEIDELCRFSHPFTLRVALSLDAAVNGTEEDEDDDAGHPF